MPPLFRFHLSFLLDSWNHSAYPLELVLSKISYSEHLLSTSTEHFLALVEHQLANSCSLLRPQPLFFFFITHISNHWTQDWVRCLPCYSQTLHLSSSLKQLQLWNSHHQPITVILNQRQFYPSLPHGNIWQWRHFGCPELRVATGI